MSPGCTENAAEPGVAPPQSILFIGNSFTSANGGLDVMVDELATSLDPASELFTAAITADGATLKQLWQAGDATEVLRLGAYEVVVLQDDIPEGSVEAFQDYAGKFVTQALNAGTRPVLLMGWAYDRLGWISQQEIAQAHYALAEVAGVTVAPVGLAWSRARQSRPGLELFAGDREHPSLAGSYLTACVVYAAVMGESPEGARVPAGGAPALDGELASFLQRLAWETVRAEHAGR